jgi:hypothetical protein
MRRMADIVKDEGVPANRLRFLLSRAGTPVGGPRRPTDGPVPPSSRSLAPVPEPGRPRPVLEPDRWP